jgi:hypothetical protein
VRSGHEPFGDRARQKPDDDDPQPVHRSSQPLCL